ARSSLSRSISSWRVVVAVFGSVIVGVIVFVSVDLILHKHDVMKSSLRITSRGVAATAIVLATVLAGAQTRITPPPNNYSPAQDVELGREAAAQARQQLPILRDDNVSSYLEEL